MNELLKHKFCTLDEATYTNGFSNEYEHALTCQEDHQNDQDKNSEEEKKVEVCVNKDTPSTNLEQVMAKEPSNANEDALATWKQLGSFLTDILKKHPTAYSHFPIKSEWEDVAGDYCSG